MSLRYISLFSGIGGLEHPVFKPIQYVEWDVKCAAVLRNRCGNTVEVHSDVRTYTPPRVDAVIGGWPCQDISDAGKKAGLSGDRSILFYELVRVAVESHAETIIGENVPRAYTNDAIRLEVEQTFKGAGFTNIVWRILNARSFGLPHHRNRAFVVASRNPLVASALMRPLPSIITVSTKSADAFYWTAGTHGICYSKGFSPTLKVGSGLSIPSPPAVFVDGVARNLSPIECLKLQGFDTTGFEEAKPSDIYRMAGNAVAAPVGAWVVSCLDMPESGPEMIGTLADNLGDFLLPSHARLGQRAASGLLRRLSKSGKPCPDALRNVLLSYAG